MCEMILEISSKMFIIADRLLTRRQIVVDSQKESKE
jgi:hypothetical protein